MLETVAMSDKTYHLLTSAIYCFADDLGKALEALNHGNECSESLKTLDLVGLPFRLVFEEMHEDQYLPFWLAAKKAFQKTLGIDPANSEAPWPPEDDEHEMPLSEYMCPVCGLHALEVMHVDDKTHHCGECGSMLTWDEIEEYNAPDEQSKSPFQTITDHHDGRLDLRATIRMPGGFMVEVAIEDVMGSPDVALYAGKPDDPDSQIPGELVCRWDVARMLAD